MPKTPSDPLQVFDEARPTRREGRGQKRDLANPERAPVPPPRQGQRAEPEAGKRPRRLRAGQPRRGHRQGEDLRLRLEKGERAKKQRYKGNADHILLHYLQMIILEILFVIYTYCGVDLKLRK